MLYYQPSGKLPPRVLFWALVSSIVLMPIAWAYAWLNHFAPAGPLALLYSTVFVACCASAAFLTAKRGKARNPRQMALVGAAIGLIGWYCQWVAWLSIASEQPAVAALFNGAPHGIIDIATAPGRMVALVHQIREAQLVVAKAPGTAWILELLFVTAMPALFAYGKAIAPFCETSDRWGESTELTTKYAFITEAAQFVTQLEADPRATLEALMSFPATDSGFSSITIVFCRPSAQAFLSIDNTARSGKDGTKKTTTTKLVSYLAIDLLLADDLMRRSARGARAQSMPPEEADPPELQRAIDQLKAGNYEDALSCAAPYLASGQTQLCNDAIRLSALAASRMEQWDTALEFWRTLFDREATAHNALQVATTSVMAGQVPQGEQWVRAALTLSETSGDCPRITITTNFITALKNSGNARLALSYLEEVKLVYQQLHMTDSTFLYLRGVPAFSSFLDNSRLVVASALSATEARRWYESMIPHLDSDGQGVLQQWLQAGMPEFTPVA